jgi:hypothetical protein
MEEVKIKKRKFIKNNLKEINDENYETEKIESKTEENKTEENKIEEKINNENQTEEKQTEEINNENEENIKKRKREIELETELTQKKKNYREPRLETPSHPGGVKQKEKIKKSYNFESKEIRRKVWENEEEEETEEVENEKEELTIDEKIEIKENKKDENVKKNSRNWESPSPYRNSNDKDFLNTPTIKNEEDKQKEKGLWETEEDLEKDWYDDNEESESLDLTKNPFDKVGKDESFRKKEQEYIRKEGTRFR